MRKWCLGWLLVAMLVTGCAKESAPEPTQQTEKPINAGAAYTYGKNVITSAENLILEYTFAETRIVGSNTFTKQITGTASYQDYCQAEMQAKVEESLDFGYYRCDYTTCYYRQKAYANVNACCFWTNQSPETFTSRQLPPVLLTPAFYDTITYGEIPGTVLFSNPRILETWVGEGQLLAASGEAMLDGAGKLQQTSYQASYRKGEAEYTVSVTMKVTLPEQLDLSGIQTAESENGVWLSDLDAPRKLVQVVADVYAAQSMGCVLSETIISEAIPLSYGRSSDIQLNGRGEALFAEIANISKLSNNRGVVTETSQTERFENRVYSVSIDGGSPVPNGSITSDSVRQYCEDTILSGLLAVKYLRSASLQVEGDLLRLELGGDLVFREMMTKHLQDVLQVDLDTLADVSEHRGSGGYLTVDLETGLPVSFGMYLEKSHTMNGITYGLNYSLGETLTFS